MSQFHISPFPWVSHFLVFECLGFSFSRVCSSLLPCFRASLLSCFIISGFLLLVDISVFAISWFRKFTFPVSLNLALPRFLICQSFSFAIFLFLAFLLSGFPAFLLYRFWFSALARYCCFRNLFISQFHLFPFPWIWHFLGFILLCAWLSYLVHSPPSRFLAFQLFRTRSFLRVQFLASVISRSLAFLVTSPLPPFPSLPFRLLLLSRLGWQEGSPGEANRMRAIVKAIRQRLDVFVTPIRRHLCSKPAAIDLTQPGPATTSKPEILILLIMPKVRHRSLQAMCVCACLLCLQQLVSRVSHAQYSKSETQADPYTFSPLHACTISLRT